MTTQINLKQIRALPQLHLFGHQQFDTASTYASFMKSILEGFCFTSPSVIQMMVDGRYHIFHAKECHLDLCNIVDTPIPADYGGNSGLIDWLFSTSILMKEPNHLLPFEGIALIVYLSKWCMTDISTTEEHFQQIFYEGKAVTPCIRSMKSDLSPEISYIRLQLLLSKPQFLTSSVTNIQIQQAVAELKKYQLLPSHFRLEETQLYKIGFEIKPL